MSGQTNAHLHLLHNASICVCEPFACYSLPRHKSSGAIKGFCFIEFSTVEEAEACLEVQHLCAIHVHCTCVCRYMYTLYEQ